MKAKHCYFFRQSSDYNGVLIPIPVHNSNFISSKLVWECLGELNNLSRENRAALYWVPVCLGNLLIKNLFYPINPFYQNYLHINSNGLAPASLDHFQRDIVESIPERDRTSSRSTRRNALSLLNFIIFLLKNYTIIVYSDITKKSLHSFFRAKENSISRISINLLNTFQWNIKFFLKNKLSPFHFLIDY